MALACVLAARHGWSADEALEAYWARVPLARDVMETYGQAAFVRQYVASRRPYRTSQRRNARYAARNAPRLYPTSTRRSRTPLALDMRSPRLAGR